MKTLIALVLLAFAGLIQLAHGQVAADPTYWADLGKKTSKKDFGLGTLDMRVNYFGEFLGPNIGKMDDNQYDQTGAKTRDPIMVLHSISIHTMLTDQMRLTISPRFMTPVGDRNELRETDDQHSIMNDDWSIALTQTWVRGEKWTIDTRLQERLPVSQKSKNDHIDGQSEIRQGFSYRARPELTFTTQSTLRYYHYDGVGTEERYRALQATFVNYIHNDRWNAQLLHEYELQHRNPKEGNGVRDWNYMSKYKDTLAMGVGYNFTRSFNVMPFLKALDNTNIRPETIQAGMWVSTTL